MKSEECSKRAASDADQRVTAARPSWSRHMAHDSGDPGTHIEVQHGSTLLCATKRRRRTAAHQCQSITRQSSAQQAERTVHYGVSAACQRADAAEGVLVYKAALMLMVRVTNVLLRSACEANDESVTRTLKR